MATPRLRLGDGARFAPSTANPRQLIQALTSGGATILDGGVSGQGGKAVHRYTFRLPIKVGTNETALLETGTILVGVDSGRISEISWTVKFPPPSMPPGISIVGSTTGYDIRYSDYGTPVTVKRP
jgi:hypothetical protein